MLQHGKNAHNQRVPSTDWLEMVACLKRLPADASRLEHDEKGLFTVDAYH